MTTHRKTVTSVSLDVPRLLLTYAAGLGIDRDAVCQSIDLNAASLQTPDGHITLDQFHALWAEVAHRTNDPVLGIHFGEAVTDYAGSHILLGIMMNCRTLHDALGCFCRYHGLITDEAPPELLHENRHTVFRLGDTTVQSTDYLDAVLAMLTVIIRRLTENRVQPVEVHLRRTPPSNVTEYQRIFNIPLRFEQPYGELVFDRDSLSTTIFVANATFREALEHVAQHMMAQLTPATTWTRRTGSTMAEFLERGDLPRLPAVAQVLAISPRHLQNKLRLEGTSFQLLLDSVRRQMALDCLNQTEMTLCEIAFLVGFADQSAFNHAFRRWTGKSPQKYRLLRVG